jgi:hypothetical protein
MEREFMVSYLKMKKIKKQYPHAWWLKKTNIDFNKMVRLEESKDGYGTCITCGQTKHYKEANAGHFRHGLDFIRDNQHFQCVNCNQWLSGRLDRYTLWMIDKFGRARVDEIQSMPRTKYSIPELQEMRAEYKQKIKDLEGRIYG